MTKRKSPSSKKGNANKKSRGGEQGRGDVEADAASAASKQADADEMRSIKVASQRAARTLELVDTMRGAGSLLERVKATCKLLEEDSKREESLLDMSLLVDGDEVSCRGRQQPVA